MLNCSYWQFVVHGQEAIEQMSLVSAGFNLQNMKVSINDGSYWKKLSVLLSLVRDFPAQRKLIFLRMQCLVEVADKKELLGLLFNFFGRTLHASWKQKSCFVIFAP